MNDLVLRETHGAVAHLTLNAPASLNALSDGMLAALRDRFCEVADDAAVKVVVLKGAGKAFLRRPRPQGDAGRTTICGWGQGLFRGSLCPLRRCDADDPRPAPTRHRPGSRHCHRRRLPAGRKLRSGRGRRRNALWRERRQHRPVLLHADGRAVAQRAAQGGVRDADDRRIHRRARARARSALSIVVVPHDSLEAETARLAATIAAKLGAAVKIGKRAFYDQVSIDLAAAYEHTAAVMVENMLWRDTAGRDLGLHREAHARLGRVREKPVRCAPA